MWLLIGLGIWTGLAYWLLHRMDRVMDRVNKGLPVSALIALFCTVFLPVTVVEITRFVFVLLLPKWVAAKLGIDKRKWLGLY